MLECGFVEERSLINITLGLPHSATFIPLVTERPVSITAEFTTWAGHQAMFKFALRRPKFPTDEATQHGLPARVLQLPVGLATNLSKFDNLAERGMRLALDTDK